MKVQVSRPLSGLSIAAAIAFAAFAATAQTTPMMGGEMKGEDMVKGCDMMGGDMTCMMQMMSMMREKLCSPRGGQVDGRVDGIVSAPSRRF